MSNTRKRPFVRGRKKDKPGSGYVQIWPSVPVDLVRDSEEAYRGEVAAGARDVTPAKVQARWTELGWRVARATTGRERSKLVKDFLAGKPLALPQTEVS